MSAEIQKGIAALIGRPLLKTESENFDIYYELAKSKLNNLLGGEVFVDWNESEADLKLLLSKIFALNTQGMASGDVESKSIDGFSVKMRSAGQIWSDFTTQNAGIIAKYRKIERVKVRSGDNIYDRF